MPTYLRHLACAVLLLHGAQASAQEDDTPPIDPYDDAGQKERAPSPIEEEPALPAPVPEPAPAAQPVLPAHPTTPPPIPKAKESRAVLIAGLALGIGTISSGNESDTTVNYTLSFGGYVTRSVALLVDLWGSQHQEDSFQISNHKQGVSVLYWLNNTFWTKASLASASYATYVDDFQLVDFRGVAGGAGLGWVFFSTGNFHVDARISLDFAAYKNARDKVTSTALQIGLHYF